MDHSAADTSTTAAAPTRPGRRRPAQQHLPGLTGLRGIAVAAVVAYHLGYLHGGFIGVDLFFVLSGYLITSLLLGDPPGHVRAMFTWWGRRIRRLTPAVAVVVLAVLVALPATKQTAQSQQEARVTARAFFRPISGDFRRRPHPY